MRSVYEEKRIPLQIRRLMLFNKTCQYAKKYPDKVVQLPCLSKITFGILYSKRDKKYTAFGGIFKYAHTRDEVIRQGLNKLTHEELIMCAITVERLPFTKATRTPLGLLISWNKYVKDRKFVCIDDRFDIFFKVNDELEVDYPPHKFYERLAANKELPLWDDDTLL